MASIKKVIVFDCGGYLIKYASNRTRVSTAGELPRTAFDFIKGELSRITFEFNGGHLFATIYER